MQTVRIVGTLPPRPAWTDRLAPIDWPTWQRLDDRLRNEAGWEPLQVDSLASESLRVLRRIPDPLVNVRFQARGLVVGYVQSGKTANYTAVAARAIDAGYRIVIVLSGIHDSLRNQTQKRLEQELIGTRDHDEVSRGSRDGWVSLTTEAEDFQEPDITLLQSAGPFLAVVKKNVPVLAKLDRWLEAAGTYLDDKAVLLIDDEADQASINTKGNRPPDPSLEDDDNDDDRYAPSRTNGLIRSILARLPKAAYIAYTATPFANILIDPDAVDRRVGDDLFPRDFVIQLPRPKGYIGTEEMFGVTAQGRDVLQPIPDEDVKALRAPRRRKSAQLVISSEADVLPSSLAEALAAFCLVGAVRIQRAGFENKSHTMLVHVSQRISDQERVASSIRDQVDIWREAYRQGYGLEKAFAPVWKRIKGGIIDPPDDDAIVRMANDVLQKMVVLTLNSETGEDLEYQEKPGRHIIAVGGNRLSRGLTLEGLTISYFLRTTTMCDTLLQMARWYGFRRGYEDLIRIWTTDGIARWFAELAVVEQSLRDAIIALDRAGRRPDQMAIRLRAHSALLLTARNKAKTSVSQQDSWSGEHPQTVLLPLSDPNKLQGNRILLDNLVSGPSISLRRTTGGLLARDIAPEVVCEFLRNYEVHDDIVAFRPDLLADWIMARATVGELVDWAVYIASPETGKAASIGGQNIGLVKRSRISSESIGILIDPAHEGVDLPFGSTAYKRDSGTYDADAMRAARPSTQGLLIVYPLDAEHLGISWTDTVVALALSLPQTSDAGSTWIVNSMVSSG